MDDAANKPWEVWSDIDGGEEVYSGDSVYEGYEQAIVPGREVEFHGCVNKDGGEDVGLGCVVHEH